MPEMNSIRLIELSSIAAGYLVSDAMLKAADVELLLSRSICSGKYIVMVGGHVAAVRASVDAGTVTGTGMVIDTFVIPNVHKDVFLRSPAFLRCKCWKRWDVEAFSVASLIEGRTLGENGACPPY